LSTSAHPLAPHHLPPFFTAPGETDIFMVIMAIFLVLAVLAVGLLFLRLHTLPERMAHKSQKLQFEIVAVLGLLALFTHQHIFWVAGLLLAVIDLPDFGTPLRRIAGSVEKIAGVPPGEGAKAAEDAEAASLALNNKHGH
jgi:multisubunit Na+/H+ antiporter MnhF subunit